MSYSGLVGGWREASWSLGAITKTTLDGTVLIDGLVRSTIIICCYSLVAGLVCCFFPYLAAALLSGSVMKGFFLMI